jgi:hypothetical protein
VLCKPSVRVSKVPVKKLCHQWQVIEIAYVIYRTVICVSGSRRSPFLIEFGTLSIVDSSYDRSSVLAVVWYIRFG